ncbi:MAG: hypothetical protein LBD34_04050 [Puniceicoccales bacterium]|jgi:hypothetical protein|nr:hypothetical protein [Puniceicoccales bacterium]
MGWILENEFTIATLNIERELKNSVLSMHKKGLIILRESQKEKAKNEKILEKMDEKATLRLTKLFVSVDDLCKKKR